MTEILPGEFIRQHRKRADLSQEQLGKAVGVSRGYINMIENAESRDAEPPNLSDDLLKKLADRLHISHSEILEVFNRPMYVTDPDIKLIVEEATGNQESRDALASMAAALRSSRKGSIGKRAE